MDLEYIKTLEKTPYKLYYLINVECGKLTFASGGHFGFMQIRQDSQICQGGKPS